MLATKVDSQSRPFRTQVHSVDPLGAVLYLSGHGSNVNLDWDSFAPSPPCGCSDTRCPQSRHRRFAATQAFLSGVLTLSITIRGDIRALPTAPVTYLFDEIRGQLRVKMTFFAPGRSTSGGRVVHLGPKPRAARVSCRRWLSGGTHLTHGTHSHCQVPAITPRK